MKKIWEGIKNNFLYPYLSSKEANIVRERRSICSSCPYNSKTSHPYCELCGCDIKWKTASLSSSCGAEEYNKDNPQDQKPVRWYAKD